MLEFARSSVDRLRRPANSGDQALRRRIDGSIAECGVARTGAGVNRVDATCPDGAFREGNNMLALRIAHPVRPIDLHINGDRRHLGLGLEALMLEARARGR